MTEHAVVIAGGGPTGLTLAGELALANVDVAIVERRPNQELAGVRASGLKARTLEVLDQRGIVERFVSQGQRHTTVPTQPPVDMADVPTRHNYVLALFQNHIERILADWVIGELKVPIYRACEVSGFVQDESGVNVELAEDRQTLRAQYLVGCDGGRSVVRKRAGIEFAGWDATTSWLIAEVETTDEPAWGFRHDALGSHAIAKMDDGRRARIVLTERQAGITADPTLRDISEALVAVYGTDFGVRNPTWLSRFNDMARQAVSYRSGCVLLAGDAAHVHAPLGGHGLNLGVQDAVNLGWKLAQVVKGISTDSLLDTYHAERHPVAARVLRDTMALVALRRPDEHTKALGEYVSRLVNIDEVRRRVAAEQTGLDIRYDLDRTGCDEPHPLLGRRMPDLDLLTAKGPLRVFSLLHAARPVLLNFGDGGAFDITGWADRVQSIHARYEGQWELPAIGQIPAPTTVLVRPDGYVAWTGDQTQRGLANALTTWFGPPSPC
jgi:3-(3-hydroxy-phenyl)propionate hydroxylase